MLVETPATFVRNYKLQLQAGSLDTLAGWVQLDGAQAAQTVTLEIAEAGIRQQITTDANGRGEFVFNAPQLELWSPDNPKLYQVSWHIAGDSTRDEIGFRSIAAQGEDILLNGEKIFLRGVSMHEESLLRHGRAVNQADADAAVEKLKALNANFVRLAHYPHNEYMVRAAERAGIMVWAEMPVYHNIQFANPCTLASAKRQYSELIARDQNRAAVILWSLGNETQVSDARNAFFVAMAEHVRQLDNTRPLTAALLGFDSMAAVGRYLATKLAAQQSSLVKLLTNPEPPAIEITDPLGEIVDVLGYNEYFGWYMSGPLTQGMRAQGLDVSEDQVRDMMLKEMEQFVITTPFNKPLVISEFGAGAKQGMRGGELDIWTEDYQARVYRQQIKMLANSPALRGMSPWVLKDFRAPYRLNTAAQDYWNRKGLVSETGVEKQAFKVMSDYYRSKQAQ
jgi:beta-glucuronidase